MFDLDGVLYLDDQGIPGAGAALGTLRAAGFRFVYATNNSTKSAADVVAHIAERTGWDADPGDVVTSGMATAAHLGGRGPLLVLGGEMLAATLAASGAALTTDWQEARIVVVGLDVHLTYERLSAAVLAVGNGADLVATNVDATYPTPEGLLPGGGAIVAAVTKATGVAPVVCGKPHLPMRRLVRERVGTGPAWVVGDRPETDVAMGKAEGWGTVLTLSGVVSDPASVPDEWAPDIVVASVADLPAALPAG